MEQNLTGEITIAASIAQDILSTSIRIPPMPGNGSKILYMARQPIDDIDIPSFAKLVESDPSLLARVLQLSNSSYYGEMQKIVTLRAAITRIGLTEMVNSVCLYIFQKMLPKFPDIEGFTYKNFWSRSWACGVASRRLGHPNLEMGISAGELYIAGLLSGMGKLLLAIHFPDQFTKCIDIAKNHKRPLHLVEKDEFGTLDALVAARIMKFWKLPDNICNGVAFQQFPELAPGEDTTIAGLIQFANTISDQSKVGKSGDGVDLEISDCYFAKEPGGKLSNPKIQDQLIGEIQAELSEKADPDGTGNRRQRPKPVRSRPVAVKPEKKSFFGWLKSLFSG